MFVVGETDRCFDGGRTPSIARQPVPQLLPQRPAESLEIVRLPELELVPLPDEGHMVADTGMIADHLGEHHPSVPVDLESFGVIIKPCRGHFLVTSASSPLGGGVCFLGLSSTSGNPHHHFCRFN